MRLSDEQRAALDTRCWTTIPAVVVQPDLVEMVDRAWSVLAKRGLQRDDPSSWPERLTKLQDFRKAGVFDAFLGATVNSVADQLIGAGAWTTLGVRPQALVTMPTPAPWSVPHQVWHLDLPGRGPTQRWAAVRYFGLATNAGPRSGTTLVVEGSHELVRQMVAAAPGNDAGSSSTVRARLREHDFFQRLSQPDSDATSLMTDGDVINGVGLRVAELTGRAGDLIVMHPWMLHNLSMNTAGRIRIAMSYSLYATGVQGSAGSPTGELGQ